VQLLFLMFRQVNQQLSLGLARIFEVAFNGLLRRTEANKLHPKLQSLLFKSRLNELKKNAR